VEYALVINRVGQTDIVFNIMTLFVNAGSSLEEYRKHFTFEVLAAVTVKGTAHCFVTLCGTIILPVVVYECGICSLTVRQEHRLRVFENRLLRIFGLKRYEVIGAFRNLHNEEFYNCNSSPNIIRMIESSRMRGAGIVACMGEKRKEYRISIGNPEGKTPLERSRHMWEDNNVTDLINALPGKNSVNTVQHATVNEAVFPVSSAPRLALLTDQ
jgi:hypothetical protein